MERPNARYANHISCLGYVERHTEVNGFKTNGIALFYRVGKNKSDIFKLSMCDLSWEPIDNHEFTDFDQLFLVAESFLGIKQKDWVFIEHDKLLPKINSRTIEEMHNKARHEFNRIISSPSYLSEARYWKSIGKAWALK